MSLRVNTNIAAMNAYRQLSNTEGSLSKNLEKLSSGFRINRAADDAAGLVNSEQLRSQVGGLKVASRNAQDGISVAQTAEGALNEVHSILQRMRDLSVQRANSGSNSATALRRDRRRVLAPWPPRSPGSATRTKFNGMTLLNGSYSGTFQVGANAGRDRRPSASSRRRLRRSARSPPASAARPRRSASSTPRSATSPTQRGTLGAFQNRMEHTIANLGVAVENLSASESRIRDTDMAQEMTTFSKNQILQQAGTAMLAQANQSSQGVLSLLRG